jgi:hypothetical protein
MLAFVFNILDQLHDFLEKVTACDGHALIMAFSKIGKFTWEH